MTKDQLLAPRYKVIADYPDSPYTIGDILSFQQWGGDLKKWAHYNDEGIFMGFTDDFDEYPHIFKPLQWWEERELSSLPKYLKGLKQIKRVIKYEYHGGTLDDNKTEYPSVLFENETIWCPIWMYEPSTTEEYEPYLQTTNQLNDGQ